MLDTVEAFRVQGYERIDLGVCCNWGKHRSVAFSKEIVEHLKEHRKQDFIAEVHHLERHAWDRDAPPCTDFRQVWRHSGTLDFVATGRSG